jgi:SAM-dependent methyltransferase
VKTAPSGIDDFYDPLFYEARGERASAVEICTAEGVGSGSVLELGCGLGDVLIPLARKGINVCGVDSSDAMLERFRERLAAESPETRNRVTLVSGDMLHFEWDQRFDWVLIPNDGVAHILDDSELLRLCRIASRHLAAGGRILGDMTPFDVQLLGAMSGSHNNLFSSYGSFELPDGESGIVSAASSFDQRSGVLTILYRYEFIGTDSVVRRARYRRLHIYPRRPSEIRLALMLAGFDAVQTRDFRLSTGERRVVFRGALPHDPVSNP